MVDVEFHMGYLVVAGEWESAACLPPFNKRLYGIIASMLADVVCTDVPPAQFRHRS